MAGFVDYLRMALAWLSGSHIEEPLCFDFVIETPTYRLCPESSVFALNAEPSAFTLTDETLTYSLNAESGVFALKGKDC